MIGMKNLFITSLPETRKTTLIRKIAGDVSRRIGEAAYSVNLAGFYAEEIRKRGIRQGFELTSLDGRKGILSPIDFNGGPSVGRYGRETLSDTILESVQR
jgi:nucleoside-triphosphatase THEP1